MKRRHLSFVLPVLLPVFVFTACGSDDSTGAPVTSDAGADSAHDASMGTGDSGNHVDAGVHDGAPIDAPTDTRAADAPQSEGADAADAEVDAAPGHDASADDASDSATDIDANDASTGIDANDSSTGIDAGNDGGADAGNDAAVPIDAASADAAGSDASGTCNNLANDGIIVSETNVAGTAPAPAGGTILLGNWRLTAWQNFQTTPLGPTGNTRKTAFNFTSSTTYEKVTADNGISDEHDSRTYTTDGMTTLFSNQTCPTVDSLSSDYSVLAGGKTLMLFSNSGNTVLTFVHP